MIYDNNYLADIRRVCEINLLIWVMRFQSPLVYLINHFTNRDLILRVSEFVTPGSGVMLDCIDSWSLHPYLFQ